MSKFTIVVHDAVSVAAFAEAMAREGYALKWRPDSHSCELTETDERKAQIAESFARGEQRRRQFLEAGIEP